MNNKQQKANDGSGPLLWVDARRNSYVSGQSAITLFVTGSFTGSALAP